MKVTTKKDAKAWHDVLGHVGVQGLKTLKEQVGELRDVSIPEDLGCTACALGKMHKLPHGEKPRKPTNKEKKQLKRI